MKYILLLLFLLAHISCEKSGIETPIGFTVYKLDSIYGGLSGQTILAQDLDFNEMIIIQKDSTFFKERVYSDSTISSTGDFELFIREDDGQKFFKFTYVNNDGLIENCNNSLIEYYVILNEKSISNGGSVPCDGPGYSYSKIR